MSIKKGGIESFNIYKTNEKKILITEPLAHIFNESLQMVIWHDVLKISDVVPNLQISKQE